MIKHTTRCSATLDATVDEIWAVWADMATQPRWDLRQQEVHLDGPFQTASTGWSRQVGAASASPFTLTLVEPKTRWVSERPLPGGRLVTDHRVESTGRRRVLIRRDFTAHGPLAIVFAAVISSGIRRQTSITFAALEAEAWRRARSL